VEEDANTIDFRAAGTQRRGGRQSKNSVVSLRDNLGRAEVEKELE
jgi:hypothetical protein